MRISRFAVGSSVLAGLMILTACGGSDLGEPAVPGQSVPGGTTAGPEGTGAAPGGGGVIVIGSAPTLRPLEFLDESNAVTGMNPDLLRAVAAKMGKTVQFDTMSFDALIPALQSQRVSMITSMGDLPERRDRVTFIDYLKSGASFLVAAGNPKSISSDDSLCGLRVAFSRGTSQQEMVETADAWCKDNGKEEILQAAYPGSPEAILALRSGQADGAWTDRVNAGYVMQQTPDTYEVAYNQEGYGYGIGFPAADVELRGQFYDALVALKADGTYAELAEKYGLSDSVLDTFTVNTGDIDPETGETTGAAGSTLGSTSAAAATSSS